MLVSLDFQPSYRQNIGLTLYHRIRFRLFLALISRHVLDWIQFFFFFFFKGSASIECGFLPGKGASNNSSLV